jgi:uncharacterized protein (DUF488 family)
LTYLAEPSLIKLIETIFQREQRVLIIKKKRKKKAINVPKNHQYFTVKIIIVHNKKKVYNDVPKNPNSLGVRLIYQIIG